ncbi:hypothetical protein [Haloferax chudinovii]|uniref:PglZ domain-containing protein n=1 Tax=Haloferax chudinovii TaxID=1109010 RepID=A0ABD5XJB9_9EURY
MEIRSWLSESSKHIRRDGIKGVKKSSRPIYHKILSQFGRLQTGTPIYQADWDVLIVLDACRFDLMNEVEQEYDFISNVERYRSVDTATERWMQKNFVEEYQREMESTLYVCGNPFSETVLSGDELKHLIEVWRTDWESPGTVPPRAITNEVIRQSQETEYDRVIVHYMQPHCPFISRPEMSKGKDVQKFGKQDWRDVWELYRDGELERDTVWEAYKDNLRLVLDEVRIVLENIDAENVVITSDHGNAIGEWGIYGHPPGLPLDCLRVVPWIQTEAENTGSYTPPKKEDSQIEVNRDDQLKALGYKS